MVVSQKVQLHKDESCKTRKKQEDFQDKLGWVWAQEKTKLEEEECQNQSLAIIYRKQRVGHKYSQSHFNQ